MQMCLMSDIFIAFPYIYLNMSMSEPKFYIYVRYICLSCYKFDMSFILQLSLLNRRKVSPGKHPFAQGAIIFNHLC